jgi:hypothetical protein
MKLTRNAMVDVLTERNGLTREQAEKTVDAMFGAIAQALGAGEPVTLQDFGRFSLRPKHAGADPPRRGQAISFRGFGRLVDRVNAGDLIDLDQVLWIAPAAERRTENREDSGQDGTAIVRISGIPVCEFKLKSMSQSGTSFWVREDSFILRNIRVGLEIDIRIQPGPDAESPAMFRSRIAHITKEGLPGMNGHFIMGVQILGKLPME